MARKKSEKPTDAELEILRVLWDRGPSTVREVYQALNETSGYTTILKFLQIMLEKKLVTRDDSRRPHIYQASEDREITQTKFVSNLVGKLFEGSAAHLAMHALVDSRLSAEELQELRDLIDRLEEEGKGKEKGK